MNILMWVIFIAIICVPTIIGFILLLSLGNLDRQVKDAKRELDEDKDS